MIFSYRNEKIKIEETLKNKNIDQLIKDFLKPVSSFYDNFEDWLYKSLNDSIISIKRTEYRDIILNIQNHEIVGIMILKKTNTENKLCTLFVKEEYRCKGIGNLFFSIADEILENNIKLSVHYKNLHFIENLLIRFNYKRLGQINNELFFFKH